MDINNIEEKIESDSITALELQKSKRILYFSDGILEEVSESEDDIGPDITDRSANDGIDVKALPLGPRIKYQAYQIGCRFLNGVEYVGEGLASLFGITDPKYISESNIEHAKECGPHSYDLDNLSQSNDVCGLHHNNNTNTSNIVITRFSRNAVHSVP